MGHMCGVVPKGGGRSAGIRTTSLPGSTFRLSADATANLSRQPLFIESLLASELTGERMFSRQARAAKSPANLGVIIDFATSAPEP